MTELQEIAQGIRRNADEKGKDKGGNDEGMAKATTGQAGRAGQDGPARWGWVSLSPARAHGVRIARAQVWAGGGASAGTCP